MVFQTLQLFKRLGFKSVTMDDIARHLGISKKTLYEHFEDKNDLVYACVKYMLDENCVETNNVITEKLNAIEQIFHILQIMERMLQGMNPVAYHDLQRYFPKAFQYLNQHKQNHILKNITENLKLGIEQGLYRDDIDIDIIAAFRLETSMFIFNSATSQHLQKDILTINHQLFAHYTYGLVTEKGHRILTKLLKTYSRK